MLSPGTLIDQRYEILEPIGRGGMGAVYKARDTRLSSTVAIKRMLVDPTPSQVEAFRREAQLLANLHHPALPQVSNFFRDQHGYFLVMKFIEGQDIAALLARGAPAADVEQVFTWAATLLDVLIFLHQQRPPVIHRDIKPQNVKLAANGQLYLLDFGLAKGRAEHHTPEPGSDSLFGYTPQYSPIEQIQGAGTDERSDLFSLAATLYHMFSGTPPPNANARMLSFIDRQPDPLRPLTELNSAVPPLLDVVIRRSLALRASDRFASAREMRGQLEAARPAVMAAGRVRSVGQPAARTQTTAPAPAAHPAHTAGVIAAGYQAVPAGASPVTPANRQRMHLVQVLLLLGVLPLATLLLAAMDLLPTTRGRELAALGAGAYVLAATAGLAFSWAAGRHEYVLREHQDAVLGVAFAPSGRHLATAAGDGTIYLRNPSTGRAITLCSGHKPIRKICFSPDSSVLVAAAGDARLQLWQARDGAPLPHLIGHTAQVWDIALAPAGDLLASAAEDATVRLWNLHEGVCRYVLRGHQGGVWSIAIAPDGRHIASAGEDALVRIWQLRDGALRGILAGHTEGINAMCYSPDGRLLASGAHDTTIKIWDAGSGARLHDVRGHALPITRLAFHPGGRLLASCSRDATICLWRIGEHRPLCRLTGHSDYISAMAFSPDGRTLASASWDATVRLWRVRDGAELDCLRGHTARIHQLAFAPDGRTLVSGSLDRTVRVWKL